MKEELFHSVVAFSLTVAGTYMVFFAAETDLQRLTAYVVLGVGMILLAILRACDRILKRLDDNE
jgi:hypothetical protein